MAYNWGRGLGGAGTGAIAGAQIGSAVPGIGTAIGAGVGGLAGLFGGFGDEDVEEPLNQIPDEIKKYLDQYINTGADATGRANTEFGRMLSNPNDIIEQLSKGYKPSAGYQFKLGQGVNAVNSANAAGGMVGTEQNKQQGAQLAEHLADEDFQNYLNTALGVYNTGAAGTLGLSNQGATAASDLSTSLANVLGSKATLRNAGNANRNQASSGLMQGILEYLGRKK